MTGPLSKHVPVPDAERRLDRIWLHVKARVEKPKRPARRALPWAFAGAALAAVVAALYVGWPGASSSGWEGATLETASDRLEVNLDDGSRLELARETKLFLAEAEPTAVEVALLRGRVECDVVHNPARRFTVSTGGVEVRVLGTRFSVERSGDGQRVTVSVERGSVEVLVGGREVRRLGRGETWSLEEQTEPRASATPATPEPQVPEAPSAGPRPEEPAIALEPSEEESPKTTTAPTSAKDLLERANAARRDGDVNAAARDYQKLLDEYPSDGRAGLAAFELGRLRMDRLGDLPGAVSALKRAVALAPGSGFREDAMARLVRAYDALGQKDACRSARQKYLSAYPRGVHAEKLAPACD